MLGRGRGRGLGLGLGCGCALCTPTTRVPCTLEENRCPAVRHAMPGTLLHITSIPVFTLMFATPRVKPCRPLLPTR